MYQYIYQEILDTIKGIETEFPVHNLTYKKIRIWPLIKADFKYQFINNTNIPSEFDSIVESKNIKQKIGDVILAYRHLKIAKARFRKDQKSSVNTFPSKTYKKGVFITFTSFRNQKVKDRYYNIQSDSFLASLKNPENTIVLEFTLHHNKNSPYFSPTFNIDNLRSKAEFIQKKNIFFEYLKALFYKKNITQTFGFDKSEFETFLKKGKYQVNFNFSTFSNQMNHILLMKELFIELYKKLKPEFVACPVFFAHEAFASTLACKELGIKTIEVQHGNYATTVYEFNCEMPKDGFEIMPDYFLSWDKEQSEIINNWSSNIKTHKALIYGINPLKFWIKNKPLFNNTPLETLSTHFLNSNLIHVIYTISDSIDEKIPELILKTQGKLFWYIRNHPRTLNSQLIIDLKEFLKQHNCVNYDIENTTLSPLYSVLEKMDYHLTSISSVVCESIALKIKSIVINESGIQLYQPIYHNNPFILFEIDIENILKIITKKPIQIDLEKMPSEIITKDIMTFINSKA